MYTLIMYMIKDHIEGTSRAWIADRFAQIESYSMTIGIIIKWYWVYYFEIIESWWGVRHMRVLLTIVHLYESYCGTQ